MKSNLLQILAIIIAVGSFYSCDNTVNVNAEWKEIMVVYGLLNPTDDFNYIRINKAYLNPDGNAVQIAGISDSLYFDSLDVKLEEFRNGVVINVLNLELVDGNKIGIPKDKGLFASDVNYLYRLNDKIKNDAGNSYSYRLYVFNKKSGKIVTAATDIVKSLKLNSPLSNINPNPSPANWKLNIPDDGRPIIFNYTEAASAKMYDLILRFRYEEWEITNPGQIRKDSFDWLVFSGKETKTVAGGGEKNVLIAGMSFYNMAASQIPVKPGYKRKVIDLDLYFYGAGQELFTYINVNRPSLGIVQKKPEYTNIEGGLGIFSSRYINRLVNIKVDSLTIKRLQTNEVTRSLNF
jgi:hypothetical protein